MAPIETPVETTVKRQDAKQTNTSPRPNSGILDHDAVASAAPWTPASVVRTIPAHSQPAPHTSSPVPFLHLLARLKTTKREGWRRFGIDHGESVADHMYRMALMTMLAPPALAARLDVQRCTKMALVHDMAELLVGDITPVDGVLKSEKSRREAAAIDYLCADLLGAVDAGVQGAELRAVWQEYEDGVTPESVFVHDVDKMELIMQTVEYEKAHGGRLDLGEFSWVARRIVLPEVKQWCDQVLAERDEYWRGLGLAASGCELALEREKLQVEYYGNGSASASSNGHVNGA